MNIIPPVNQGTLRSTYLCDFSYYSGTNLLVISGLSTQYPIPDIQVGDIVSPVGYTATQIYTVEQIEWDAYDGIYIIHLNHTIEDLGVIDVNFYYPQNIIRYADFVRLTTRVVTTNIISGTEYTIISLGDTNWALVGIVGTPEVGQIFTATGSYYTTSTTAGYVSYAQVYRFSTAPTALTISSVDSEPFNGLGQLVQIGSITRDIKSTANETTFTLVGIDTSMLSLVLGADLKGSLIEAWHGFFDASGTLLNTGGSDGLYKYFTGYINSFSISEQWMEEIRMYTGAVTVSASSIQIILRNRVAGRYTNDSSWQFFNDGDTSMQRVAFISNINYAFGKTA